MTDAFTPSPELAEKAAAMAQKIYEQGFKLRSRVERAEAELAEAREAGAAALVEYQWVLTHPALPEGWEPTPVTEEAGGEPAAPKRRTRRTKEQIAADKAREEAERAAADEAAETRIEEAAAYTSVEPANPAQAVEGAVEGGPVDPTKHVVTTTAEGATVAKFPVNEGSLAADAAMAQAQAPAQPAPAPVAAPPSGDLFDPFGQGA